MKKRRILLSGHSIGSFFSVLLFGLFVLFLMLILLFSAQIYQNSVAAKDRTQTLYTASAYLETKFRQHDAPEQISSDTVDGLPALVFHDTIDGEDFRTAIYLQGTSLKELFTPEGSAVSPEVGTPLAELSSFSFEPIDGYWKIALTDLTGSTTALLMHPGSPAELRN